MNIDVIYKALQIVEIARDYPHLAPINQFFMRVLDDAAKECAEEMKKILEEDAKKKSSGVPQPPQPAPPQPVTPPPPPPVKEPEPEPEPKHHASTSKRR